MSNYIYFNEDMEDFTIDLDTDSSLDSIDLLDNGEVVIYSHEILIPDESEKINTPTITISDDGDTISVSFIKEPEEKTFCQKLCHMFRLF